MAQSKKQLEKFGDKSFAEKDFYGASLYYRKAMLPDSSDLSVVYKYAESLRLYNEYELGELYYQYLFNKDKGRNWKEALFWLASMQKYNGKYQEARKNFSKFSSTYKDKDSFFFKKAKQEEGSCEFAQQLIQDTSLQIVKNLGPSVNTTNAEISPYPANDSLLYFSSLRSDKVRANSEIKDPDYVIRIYSAVKKDTLWVLHQPLSEKINDPAFHNGNITFSTDKKYLLFSRCDKDYVCKIMKATSENDGSFQKVNALEGPVNDEGYTFTQPHITRIDGKEILYFVSDRPGGAGRLDIWYGELVNGRVENIRNAGNVVNSIDDELTPFYVPENRTLYFSSGWHYGLGGYDIFSSKGIPERLEKPVNLGYPVNTSTNDFYYAPGNTSSGFLISNRKGSITNKGETCCNDIWLTSPVIEVKDTIPVPTPTISFDKYIPVKLYFHNDEPNPRTTDTLTSLDYYTTYKSYSSLRHQYKKEYSKGLAGQEIGNAQKEIDDFFETSVERGASNLEAFTEQLLQALQKGQRLEVTVKGFASPLAKTEYNINLTLRRISSMENYMKQYKDGALLPYFNNPSDTGGHVRIIRVPFGEYKALSHVNDKLEETRNSVYSPQAALERKIEIVSVHFEKSDTLTPKFKVNREIHNFGTVLQKDSVTYNFTIKNTGKKPFEIQQVSDSCQCLSFVYDRSSLPPGKQQSLKVSFGTGTLTGKRIEHFWIEISGGIRKELTITAEVESDKKP